MGKTMIDITGNRFGLLTAVKFIERKENITYWEFQCDCGNSVTRPSGNIIHKAKLNNQNINCGCKDVIRKRTTNTMCKHPLYGTWNGMKNRCFNESSSNWKHYGGRGITVCERWLDFQNFIADMGERPEGKSIDRIDNNGNYAPENCRWATDKEQGRNKRTNCIISTSKGDMCVAEAAEIAGIWIGSMNYRINTKTDSNEILENRITKRKQTPRNLESVNKTIDFVKSIVSELLNKGMTQSYIASIIGTSQACISRWLSGENIPSGDLLMKLITLNEKKM